MKRSRRRRVGHIERTPRKPDGASTTADTRTMNISGKASPTSGTFDTSSPFSEPPTPNELANLCQNFMPSRVS